jgi:hypothetical protein
VLACVLSSVEIFGASDTTLLLVSIRIIFIVRTLSCSDRLGRREGGLIIAETMELDLK